MTCKDHNVFLTFFDFPVSFLDFSLVFLLDLSSCSTQHSFWTLSVKGTDTNSAVESKIFLSAPAPAPDSFIRYLKITYRYLFLLKYRQSG
jgi:hypothetical protein